MHRAEWPAAFLPRTNDLGPGWNSLAGIQTTRPRQPRLSVRLPLSSQGVNLHLGQFQIKLDSRELLLGDPGPPMSLELPSYTLVSSLKILPGGGGPAESECQTPLGSRLSWAAS